MDGEKTVTSNPEPSRKWLFRWRTLLILILACGLVIASLRWWLYLGRLRVTGADRAVIQELTGWGDIKAELVVTDPAEVKALADGLAACAWIRLDNKCEPPLYRIELFCGAQSTISVTPTPCCGIFEIDGVLYRDRQGILRDAVDKIVKSHDLEARSSSSKRVQPAGKGHSSN